jgi:hypothetical protein
VKRQVTVHLSVGGHRSQYLRTQTVRHVKMLNGVEIIESKAQKDELILEGNDIDNVSQSGVLSVVVCQSLPDIFSKLLQFKGCVACETRTFGNSWMVFTCLIGAQLQGMIRCIRMAIIFYSTSHVNFVVCLCLCPSLPEKT